MPPALKSRRVRPGDRTLGWAGSGRGLSAPASPGDRGSELPTITLTVPSPEGSGSAGRLKESGFGIGLRLCLALLPSGRPASDFTASSPKGVYRYAGDHSRQDRLGFPKRLNGHGQTMVQIGLASKGGIRPQARFRGISPVISLWIVSRCELGRRSTPRLRLAVRRRSAFRAIRRDRRRTDRKPAGG